ERQSEGRDFEKSEAIAAYMRPIKYTSEPKPAVRAEQIMSAPIVSIERDMRIDKAQEMVKQKRFRHVPVISTDGMMRGIVSDRDLFALSDSHGISKSGVVEDIMTKDVLTATPNTSIREIARVLFEERIGCMPIVDEADRVVGIITRSDILRALIKHAPLDLWI
ncbi:MAG: CBS domain-containing protein, partial [Candidatus Latescibacteria bacterium]|nr:CBS domain-containing protein [Candidatus Latescibacterota bacterium]